MRSLTSLFHIFSMTEKTSRTNVSLKSNSISVKSQKAWNCPSNLCMVKNIRFLRLSPERCQRNVKIWHDERLISPAIRLQGNRTRHYFYSMVRLIGIICEYALVKFSKCRFIERPLEGMCDMKIRIGHRSNNWILR